MSYSFGAVEEKLLETHFFLTALQKTRVHSSESRFYFSAFASAARSVTFTLQYCMHGVDGFDEWYSGAREKLKANPLAKYFVEIRNDSQKKGGNPLNKVTREHLRQHLADQLRGSSTSHVLIMPALHDDASTILADASVISSKHFKSLVSLIFESYSTFKTSVDPRWYFTKEHFESKGLSLEDALEELGYPPEWGTFISSESDAWCTLRSMQPSCELNPLFEEYLGKRINDPDSTAE